MLSAPFLALCRKAGGPPPATPRVLMLGQLPGEEYGEDLYLFNSRTDARTLLTNVPGGSLTPVGISPDGTVQCAQDFTLDAGQSPAYVWRGGVLTTYLLPDGASVEVRCMSNNGNLLGGGNADGAVIWDLGVPTVYGDPNERVYSMSGDGTVGALDSAIPLRPPRYIADGVVQTLGVVHGFARGVSNNGRYLCGYLQPDDITPYPFIYDRDTMDLVVGVVAGVAHSVSNGGTAYLGDAPPEKMRFNGTRTPLAFDNSSLGAVSPDGLAFWGTVAAENSIIINGAAPVGSGFQSTDGDMALISNVLP